MKYLYIPTLTGESAQDFIDKADSNQSNLKKVDFSHKMEIMKSILSKGKLSDCKDCYTHTTGYFLVCDDCLRKKQIKGYTYLLP